MQISLEKLAQQRPVANGRIFDPSSALAAGGAADAAFFQDSQVFHEAHCSLRTLVEPGKPPVFSQALFYVRLRCFDFANSRGQPANAHGHRHTHTIEQVRVLVRDQDTQASADVATPPTMKVSRGDQTAAVHLPIREPLTYERELQNLVEITRRRESEYAQATDQERQNKVANLRTVSSKPSQHRLQMETSPRKAPNAYAAAAAAALQTDSGDDAFRLVTRPEPLTSEFYRPPLMQFSRSSGTTSTAPGCGAISHSGQQDGLSSSFSHTQSQIPTTTKGGPVGRQNAYAVGALRLLAQKCKAVKASSTESKHRKAQETVAAFAREKYEPRVAVSFHNPRRPRDSTSASLPFDGNVTDTADALNIDEPRVVAAYQEIGTHPVTVTTSTMEPKGGGNCSGVKDPAMDVASQGRDHSMISHSCDQDPSSQNNMHNDAVKLATSIHKAAGLAAAAARRYQFGENIVGVDDESLDRNALSHQRLSSAIVERRKAQLKLMWRGRMPMGKAISKTSFSADELLDRGGGAVLAADDPVTPASAHTQIAQGEQNQHSEPQSTQESCFESSRVKNTQHVSGDDEPQQYQESVLDFDPHKFLDNAQYNAAYWLSCIDSYCKMGNAHGHQSAPQQELPDLSSKLEGLFVGGLLGNALTEALQSVCQRGCLLELHHKKASDVDNAGSSADPNGVQGLKCWQQDLGLRSHRHAALVLQLNGLQAPTSPAQAQSLLGALLAERARDRALDLASRKALHDLNVSISQLSEHIRNALQGTGTNNSGNVILQQVLNEQVLFAERSRKSLFETKRALVHHDGIVRGFRTVLGTRPWWARTLEEQCVAEASPTQEKRFSAPQELEHSHLPVTESRGQSPTRASSTQPEFLKMPDNQRGQVFHNVPLGNRRLGAVDSFGDPVSAVLIDVVLEWARAKHAAMTEANSCTRPTDGSDAIGGAQAAPTPQTPNIQTSPIEDFFGEGSSHHSLLHGLGQGIVDWLRSEPSATRIAKAAPSPTHRFVGLQHFLSSAHQQWSHGSSSAKGGLSSEPQVDLRALAEQFWRQTSRGTFHPLHGENDNDDMSSHPAAAGRTISAALRRENATKSHLGDFVPWAVALLGVLGCLDSGGAGSGREKRVARPTCSSPPLDLRQRSDAFPNTRRSSDLAEDVVRVISSDPRCLAAGRAVAQLSKSLFDNRNSRVVPVTDHSFVPRPHHFEPPSAKSEERLPALSALNPPDEQQASIPQRQDSIASYRVAIDTAATAMLACASGIEVLHHVPDSGSGETLEPGAPPTPHSSRNEARYKNINSSAGDSENVPYESTWDPYQPEVARQQLQSSLLWVCDPTLIAPSGAKRLQTLQGERHSKNYSRICERVHQPYAKLLQSGDAPPFDILRLAIGSLQATQQADGQVRATGLSICSHS